MPAGNVGAIITPLLIPALALSLGWQGAFLITGGCGILWVAAWMLFTRGMKPPSQNQDAERPANARGGQPVRWLDVLADRRTWAFAGGKALSDPVWWFLLYWAPDFFHRVFHLDMQGFAVPLALVYSAAAIGSLIGGFASGRLIARGMKVTRARKATMLVCALLVLPVPLALAVKNYWFAVGNPGIDAGGAPRLLRELVCAGDGRDAERASRHDHQHRRAVRQSGRHGGVAVGRRRHRQGHRLRPDARHGRGCLPCIPHLDPLRVT